LRYVCAPRGREIIRHEQGLFVGEQEAISESRERLLAISDCREFGLVREAGAGIPAGRRHERGTAC